MKNQTPIRKSTSPAERIKNPAGRLDWLVCQLLGELVKRRANPILTATYEEFRPQLELQIMKSLGPRNKHARIIKSSIAIARQAMLERQGGRPC